MKLLKLELYNYAYYKDLVEIDFTDNDGKPVDRILLTGKQGQGKSTISRSIRWILYGDLGQPPSDLFPWDWDWGENKIMQDDQWGRVTYLHPDKGTIMFTRKRPKSSGREINKTETTLMIENEIIEDKQVEQQFWSKYVGKNPPSIAQAEFYIRTQAMIQAKKDISNKEAQSSHLNITNIDEMISRIRTVEEELRKDYESGTEKLEGMNEKIAELANIEQEITRLNAEIEKIEGEEEDLQTELDKLLEGEKTREERLKQQKELEEAENKYSLAIQKYGIERTKFSQTLTSANGMLLPTVLYGILAEKGEIGDLPDKNITQANHLGLDKLIEAFGEKMSKDSKEELEKIAATSESFKGIDLLRAKDNAKILHETTKDYREAWQDKDKKYAEWSIKGNLSDLNLVTIEGDKLDAQTAVQLLEEKHELDIKKANLEAEKEEWLDKKDEFTSEISEDDGLSEEQLSIMRRTWISERILKDIKETKNNYEDFLFGLLIGRIKGYWNTITGEDSGFSIILHSDDSGARITLKHVKTNKIVELKYSDADGTGSSGYYETAILCMALAKYSHSGIKLPVILDDAFGDMDNDHVNRTFECVSENFETLIFVTNSPENYDIENMQIKINCKDGKATKEVM